MAGFNFDDLVEVQSDDGYRLLAEGEADFVIREFRRGRFSGSAKIAACPQAELKLSVTDCEGTVATVPLNIPLDDKLAWKITSMFQSVGLIAAHIPAGTAIRYPWAQLEGSRGRCIVGRSEWTDRNGNKRQSNNIERFIPQADGPTPLDSLVPPETFK